MGVELKKLIFNAFENNLKYIDNNGKEVNPLNDSDKGKGKAETLANELGDAIIKWVEDQKFTITNSEQSVLTQAKVLVGTSAAGPVTVTVIADDQQGLTPASVQFDVTIEAVNDPPLIISSPDSIAWEDIEYLYQIEVEDVDNDYPEGFTLAVLDSGDFSEFYSVNVEGF